MGKTETMKCFGDFTPNSEKCDKCEVNIDCFVKVYSSLECFRVALEDPQGECRGDRTAGNCVEEKVKCSKIRSFLFSQKAISCFGQFDQKSDTCLACHDFKRCEIFQIMIANLEISFQDIEDSIREQIQEFQTGDEQCFGKFDFEDECLISCDFLVHCRRESSVIPGVGCTYWKKVPEGNYEEENPCSLNDGSVTCPSMKTCVVLLEEIHVEGRKIDYKMRLYKGFLSLDEIREAAEISDG